METINRGCAHTSESNSQRTALTTAWEIPFLLVKERSWCAPKLQKMEAGPTAHLLVSFVKVTCLLTKRRRRLPWQQTAINRKLIGAQISVSDRDLRPRLNETLHLVTIIIIIKKNTVVCSRAGCSRDTLLYCVCNFPLQVIAIVTDSLTDLDIFKDLQEACTLRGVPVYILLDQSSVTAFLQMCKSVGAHLDELQVCVLARCCQGVSVCCTTTRTSGGTEQKKRKSFLVRFWFGLGHLQPLIHSLLFEKIQTENESANDNRHHLLHEVRREGHRGGSREVHADRWDQSGHGILQVTLQRSHKARFAAD